MRRHVTAPVVPSLVTVATNEPVARRTLPFGFGTSCLAASAVRTRRGDADLATDLAARFLSVWTLT